MSGSAGGANSPAAGGIRPRGGEAPPLASATRICGYHVERALAGGKSVLARDETGRQVVIKVLPRDCLRYGELLPLVRERLERVREVADVGIANLYGAEEDPEVGPVLIWQWVEGIDLSAAARQGPGLLEIARELVAAVEKLHLLGIVHGALSLRNVILKSPHGSAEGTANGAFDGRGGDGGRAAGAGRLELVLTHVSPLVIDDVRRDAADVVRMLRELNARPRPGGVVAGEDATLARILAETGAEPNISALRERLLLADGGRFVTGRAAPVPGASRSRWVALGLLGVGAAVSGVIAWWVFGPAGGGM